MPESSGPETKYFIANSLLTKAWIRFPFSSVLDSPKSIACL